MQELLNARDSLEEQLREVTLQLGHMEEQRLVALKDVETIKVSASRRSCSPAQASSQFWFFNEFE